MCRYIIIIERQVCKQKKDGHYFQYPKASQLCVLTRLAFEVPGRLYSVFVTFSESHSLIRMGTSLNFHGGNRQNKGTTLEPPIKDAPNKGHLRIKDTIQSTKKSLSYSASTFQTSE